jgi:membrane fusion protein (multidrug efflux system)
MEAIMDTVVVEREATSAPAKRRLRFGRKQLALAGLALAIILGGIGYGRYWWTTGRFIESTDDAYVGGNVTTLSPHVAGFVSQILVGDNQFVKAGELVITLDDRDYKAALAHAEAVVQNQTAALANLHAKYTLQQSMIEQAQAQLAANQAEAGWARADAARYHALALTTFGTVQNDQKAFAADRKAAAAVRAGEANLDAAKQQLAVIDTEIGETQASLAMAQADLRTAQLNLGYTQIRSPIDGYVGNRAAQVGAYVARDAYLVSVIPAHGLWVDANFKEDQLAHMRPGQPATVVADVLPEKGLPLPCSEPGAGAVFSVIPPENATGNFTKIVQRVPVRIGLDDARLGELRPGLSTTVGVNTKPEAPARD